jgi:pilus assembly protein CpaE
VKLPVILIGEDSIALASLRQQLEKELHFTVHRKVLGFGDATDLLRKKPDPTLAIVDLSREVEKSLRLAEELKLKFPDVHLVMTAADNNAQAILRSLRAGAEEFLQQPFQWTEVMLSLEKLRERITLQTASQRQQGRVVTVFSPKGGTGTTTLATNLAVALASHPQRAVCIIDLVLQFGAVTNFLNLEASYTILDLVKNLQRIDPLVLEGSLVKHPSGVRVLAEPFQAEAAAGITSAHIEEILDVLAHSFDFVIADTPKEFDESTFVALDKADVILFVMEMNVPSLKSAHRALESFERFRINTNKVRLVLNRYVESKPLTLDSVEKTLAVKTFWTLPNDYPTAVSAVNQGVLIQDISPRSRLAKSYQGLADALIQDLSFTSGRALQQEEKKPGILRRWIPLRSAAR